MGVQPFLMMHLHGLVLLSLFLPVVARRSIRVDDSQHDELEQTNTLTTALELSVDAREALFPKALGGALLLRHAPQAGAWHAAYGQGPQLRATQAQPRSMRFGWPSEWRPSAPRHAMVALALHDTSSPEADQLSPKELLSLPVPELINELASREKDLILSSSDSAKIIDKACEYASTTFDPETRTVSEDIKLQESLTSTYKALKKRGVLRGFGSCADIFLGERKQNFGPKDQERVTGLKTEAFAPPRFAGYPELLLGTISAFALIYAQEAFGLDARVIGGIILAAIAADNIALRGSIGETIARTVKPGYGKIVLEHEAGHLLVAYLLGNPIQACLLDSWSAIQDGRFYGVQAGTVFYDPELGEGMQSGRLTRTCLDRYSIVVMAGIAAEAMTRGQAEGGSADEAALIRLLGSLDGGRTWNFERIQGQARWGVSQAFLLLRDHESAYKALCEALSRGASIGEAIMAIEGALPQKAELLSNARKLSQQAKEVAEEPSQSIEEMQAMIAVKEAELAEKKAKLARKEGELAREDSDREGQDS